MIHTCTLSCSLSFMSCLRLAWDTTDKIDPIPSDIFQDNFYVTKPWLSTPFIKYSTSSWICPSPNAHSSTSASSDMTTVPLHFHVSWSPAPKWNTASPSCAFTYCFAFPYLSNKVLQQNCTNHLGMQNMFLENVLFKCSQIQIYLLITNPPNNKDAQDQMESSRQRHQETNSSQAIVGGGSRVMSGTGGAGHRPLPAPPHLPGGARDPVE